MYNHCLNIGSGNWIETEGSDLITLRSAGFSASFCDVWLISPSRIHDMWIDIAFSMSINFQQHHCRQQTLNSHVILLCNMRPFNYFILPHSRSHSHWNLIEREEGGQRRSRNRMC